MAAQKKSVTKKKSKASKRAEVIQTLESSDEALSPTTALTVPIPCQAPLDLLNGRQLSLWQHAMVGVTVAGLAESMGLSVEDVLDDIKVLVEGGYLDQG